MKDVESMTPYERWWHDEGSGMVPEKGDGAEDFLHKMTHIAWCNGEYVIACKITKALRQANTAIKLEFDAAEKHTFHKEKEKPC